jgi:hypothetical protein
MPNPASGLILGNDNKSVDIRNYNFRLPGFQEVNILHVFPIPISKTGICTGILGLFKFI